MRIALVPTAILVLCAGSTARAEEATAGSLVAFESPVGQSEERLSAKWRMIEDGKRKRIESFLVTRLGLSSTGQIQLIGTYQLSSDDPSVGEQQHLLHFRQLDLMGRRLFWSVLVDPEAETVRVLYHANEKLTTGRPLAFEKFE